MSFYFPEKLQSVPLDIPVIKPDDSDLWDSIFSKNKSGILKVENNHNVKPGIWIGLDIYRSEDFQGKIYLAKHLDCRNYFPTMFDNIFNFIPMRIKCIRAVSSLSNFYPHSDFDYPEVSFRTLISNPETSRFFYLGSKGNKVYQSLPEHTNTWVYNDSGLKHGSEIPDGQIKTMLIYYGDTDFVKLRELVDRSLVKFQEQAIFID